MSPSLGLSARRFATLHWLHWLALCLSVALTLAAYFYTQNIVDERLDARFRRQADHVVELIVERMQKYEDALWSGVSAIHSLGGDASYDQWLAFSQAMRIEQKYPGINGIGVIHYVRPEELEGYLSAQRARRPKYRIHPPHSESEYWPISYIVPVATNREAVGLDMAHESNRLTAARKARDTGQAQITGPIVLVQDAKKTPGFLFYAPFYKHPAETAPERRAALTGLVYAPFVVARLMEGTLERSNRHVGVRIVDAGQSIYDEHVPSDPRFDAAAQFRTQRQAVMYGRTWRFDLRSDKTFRQMSGDAQPITILIGGALIDGLLLLLFLGMSRNTRNAVAYADSVTRQLRARQEELEQTNCALVEQKTVIETARKEAEQARRAAEQATDAKSIFLATMSHELRTPMNGVIATAELLPDADPEERSQLTETIIRSGQTLLALINDILDFSKLDAGKVVLDPHPTELRALFDEVVTLIEPLIEANGVLVSCDIDEEVPKYVQVDPLRLRQIVLNLCSNAVKFARGGAVNISCILEQRNGSRCDLLFAVEDNGIGIADPSSLFKEFTQADAKTTRRFGGTGLGLAICKRLVELFGGSIGVESELGVGSRFFFRLRLEETTALSVPSPKTPSLPALPRHDGNVLVVDDNNVNRMVAQKLLKRMGWKVTLAEDGLQALRLAMESDFDLILMDCQMPVMDGFEATAKIREARPDAAPIIALTANALHSDRERCIAAGMSDHLPKPVRVDALRSIMAKWAPAPRPSRTADVSQLTQ